MKISALSIVGSVVLIACSGQGPSPESTANTPAGGLGVVDEGEGGGSAAPAGKPLGPSGGDAGASAPDGGTTGSAAGGSSTDSGGGTTDSGGGTVDTGAGGGTSGGTAACAPLGDAAMRAALGAPAGCGVASKTATGTGPTGTRTVAETLTRPVPSNQWWSSLSWDFQGDSKWSYGLYAHPFAARGRREGLGLSYVDKPSISADGRKYTFEISPSQQDLVVSIVDGAGALDAPATDLEEFTDWTVTGRWRAGGKTLHATLGKGMPFTWFKVEGGDAIVRFSAALDAGDASTTLVSNAENVAALTITGRTYALFAPSGATWTLAADKRSLRSSLAGKGFLAVATLPDAKPDTIAKYARHAPLFPKDTRVTWCVDEAGGKVDVDFAVTTVALEPTAATAPLLGLYPHQWKHTTAPVLPYAYESARGKLKVVEASSFRVAFPITGLLPAFPDAGALGVPGSAERTRLDAQARAEVFPTRAEMLMDVYFGGKNTAKLANLLPIYDQLGDTTRRDAALAELEVVLGQYFKGTSTNYFRYDGAWKTVLAYPAGFFSDTMLNDHHFHWGYWIYSAAMATLHDPSFAARYDAFVKTLVRDAANPLRDDPELPFMRNYDLYEGHGWASGHGQFVDGNNQESSSESINFSAGVALYGAATGNRTVRDLGTFLLAMESSAIEQYWFDADHQVFPAGYTHRQVGNIYGASADYTNWWDPIPEYIYGINYLPLTGASLHLAKHPTMLKESYGQLISRVGTPTAWRDLFAMTQALIDPATARAKYDPKTTTPEDGETRAHTLHYVESLAALGTLDTSVHGDTVGSVVFKSGSRRAYVAYAPTCAPLTAKFTDGTVFTVAPRTIVTFRDGKIERTTPIGRCDTPAKTTCE